jgi:hypothetical protein
MTFDSRALVLTTVEQTIYENPAYSGNVAVAYGMVFSCTDLTAEPTVTFNLYSKGVMTTLMVSKCGAVKIPTGTGSTINQDPTYLLKWPSPIPLSGGDKLTAFADVVGKVTAMCSLYTDSPVAAFVDMGDFVAGRTYAKNNIVHLNNVAYLSVADNPITTPGTSAEWVSMVPATITLTSGDGISAFAVNGATPSGVVAVDATVARLNAVQTFTNKTLTAPIVSLFKTPAAAGGTGTTTMLPVADGVSEQVVNLGAAQTLSNKTLSEATVSGFNESYATLNVAPGSSSISQAQIRAATMLTLNLQNPATGLSGPSHNVTLPSAANNPGKSLTLIVRCTAIASAGQSAILGLPNVRIDPTEPTQWQISSSTAKTVITVVSDGEAWLGFRAGEGM